MLIIVGQPDWPTPLFSDAMTHVTAWVRPDGSVTFTDDPYGIDRAHASALDGKNA